MKRIYFALLFMLTLLPMLLGCNDEKDTPTSIKLSMEKTLSVAVGNTYLLNLKIEPEGNYNVTWGSKNPNIASVTNGEVIGISIGTTQITATAQGHTATCEVEVTETPEEGDVKLEMEKTLTLAAGQSHALTLKIEPEGDYEVSWKSSDRKIATVSDKGVVTAIAPGETRITAAIEGAGSAICVVTVNGGAYIHEDTLFLNLDACEDKEVVKQEIDKADKQGVKHYVLKGNFAKLGLTAGYDDSSSMEGVYNPFMHTKVETIDFTKTRNFPTVKFTDIVDHHKTTTGIPRKAFISPYSGVYPELRKVILPDEVRGIGYAAFSGCTKLENIVMNNVDIIGKSSFAGCNLSALNAPNCTIIEGFAFGGFSFTSLYLPNVKIIGELCFFEEKNLESIILPKVEEILSSAFEDCDNLTTLEMPVVKSVSDAFSGCDKLTSLDLPLLEGGDFSFCKSLETVNLPAAKSAIFWNCSALTSISLPQCRGINYQMFRACSNLKYIDLPAATFMDDGQDALLYADKVTTLKLTANGDFVFLHLGEYGSPFYNFDNSKNCVLYLHFFKRPGGPDYPTAKGKNEWGGTTWKEIKYVDNSGNIIE